MMVDASEPPPPAEKVNEELPPAPKMDPLGCAAAGWGAAGVTCEAPKLKMGVADAAGAVVLALANRPVGLVSVVLPNRDFDSVAAGVAPKSGLDSVVAGAPPKRGFDSVAAGVAPNSGFGSVAAGVAPKSGLDA